MNIRLIKILLSLSLFIGLASTTFAADNKLVGHWKGSNISLNLKSNHTYSYKVKVLNFNGKWSATKNVLTLNYRILGIKKKKTAGYHFSGKNLVLRQGSKGAVTLKKQ